MLLYGLPVLFVVLLVGSLAVPFPTNILVVAAGSFVEQGDMDLASLLAVLMVGSLMGDNIGFALGRWGGKRLVRKITDRFGGYDKFVKAEAMSAKYGAVGVFLTRWLVSSLAAVVNVTCGATDFSWSRFLFWDVLGQSIWVGLYVGLGYVFSDRVQEVGELAIDLSGVMMGAACTVLLGWLLLKYLGGSSDEESSDG